MYRNFGELLIKYMRAGGYKVFDLRFILQLKDDEQINSWLNGVSIPDRDTVLSIILAMGLPQNSGNELLRSANYDPLNDIEKIKYT